MSSGRIKTNLSFRVNERQSKNVRAESSVRLNAERGDDDERQLGLVLRFIGYDLVN